MDMYLRANYIYLLQKACTVIRLNENLLTHIKSVYNHYPEIINEMRKTTTKKKKRKKLEENKRKEQKKIRESKKKRNVCTFFPCNHK